MSKITTGSIITSRKWHVMTFQTKEGALRAFEKQKGQDLRPEYYKGRAVSSAVFSAPPHVKEIQLTRTAIEYFEDCNDVMRYVLAGTPMMVLEKDKENNLYKVLFENFVGWTFNFPWFEFRKVKVGGANG